MKQKLLKLLSIYSLYLLLFFLYLAALIGGLLLVHVFINSWTLLAGFGSYNLFWLVYLLQTGRPKKLVIGGFISLIIVTSCLFLGLTRLFSYSYDLSFDGQQYHQAAVISLASGWDPIYQTKLPITGLDGFTESLVQGNPKTIWSVDASVYKLTGNINSATAINLIAMALAFSFILLALVALGLELRNATFLSLLAVCSQLFIEQLFTFREDAISYQFLLIAIASIILAIKDRHKLAYFLCTATSLIFLAGSKFTDLFVLLPFGLLLLIVVFKYRWYKLKTFWLSTAVMTLAACLTLLSPYLTNISRYHTVDYPYSLSTVAQFSRIDDTPYNLHSANKLRLFYYGIFSAADDNSPFLKNSSAQLKVPFSFDANELTAEADPSAKLAGGYGVLFSGIFLIAIVCYLYLAFKRSTVYEKSEFRWLSLTLGLIVLACLLNPVPNYARFNGVLVIFPVAIAVALIIRQRHKKRKVELFMYRLLTFFMVLNLLLSLSTSLAFDVYNFSSLRKQLSGFRQSEVTYEVYAGTFYSNYVLLRQANIKIQVARAPISCKTKLILLDDSRGTTQLCKL